MPGALELKLKSSYNLIDNKKNGTPTKQGRNKTKDNIRPKSRIFASKLCRKQLMTLLKIRGSKRNRGLLWGRNRSLQGGGTQRKHLEHLDESNKYIPSEDKEDERILSR